MTGHDLLYLTTTLVAGYIFIQQYIPARYHFSRSEGWHTYFQAGSRGIPFALGAAFFTWLISFCSDSDTHLPWVFVFLCPFLSALIGAACSVYHNGIHWKLIRKALGDERCDQIERNVKTYIGRPQVNRRRALIDTVKHNPFEKLVIQSTYTLAPVCITLKSKKVYIGPMHDVSVEHGELEYVSFIPFISGYRKEKTHQLIKEIYYAKVYSQIKPERLTDFSTVIPVSEIESIRLYDDDLYEIFHDE